MPGATVFEKRQHQELSEQAELKESRYTCKIHCSDLHHIALARISDPRRQNEHVVDLEVRKLEETCLAITWENLCGFNPER